MFNALPTLCTIKTHILGVLNPGHFSIMLSYRVILHFPLANSSIIHCQICVADSVLRTLCSFLNQTFLSWYFSSAEILTSQFICLSSSVEYLVFFHKNLVKLRCRLCTTNPLFLVKSNISQLILFQCWDLNQWIHMSLLKCGIPCFIS